MEEYPPGEVLPDADSEPLMVKTEGSARDRPAYRQKIALIMVNIIVVGYNVPLYAYYVTMEQDVNSRITADYNISERTRQDCLSGNNTNETKTHNHIQALASYWLILIGSTNLIPSFFVSLLLGPVSDKIGRKVLILIPTVGILFKYLGCLLISLFQWPIWTYSLANFIEGLTGGITLFYAGCVVYTSDNTNHSNRSFWVVMLDLTASLAGVAGNLCSGYMISGLGYTWSYIIMGIATVLTVIVIVIFIRGSPKDLATVKVFTIEHFKKCRNIFTRDNGTNRRWQLLMLVLLLCLGILGDINQSDVVTYILLNTPLCFSAVMIGNYFALTHVVMTVGGFFLICLKRLGIPETPFIFFSFSAMAGYQLLISFADDETSIYASLSFCVATVIGRPLLGALLTKLVDQDEQGALFSAVSWMISLMTVLVGCYQNALYSSTVSIWPGFVCIITSSVLGVTLTLLMVLVVLRRRQNKKLRLDGNVQANQDNTI